MPLSAVVTVADVVGGVPDALLCWWRASGRVLAGLIASLVMIPFEMAFPYAFEKVNLFRSRTLETERTTRVAAAKQLRIDNRDDEIREMMLLRCKELTQEEWAKRQMATVSAFAASDSGDWRARQTDPTVSAAATEEDSQNLLAVMAASRKSGRARRQPNPLAHGASRPLSLAPTAAPRPDVAVAEPEDHHRAWVSALSHFAEAPTFTLHQRALQQKLNERAAKLVESWALRDGGSLKPSKSVDAVLRASSSAGMLRAPAEEVVVQQVDDDADDGMVGEAEQSRFAVWRFIVFYIHALSVMQMVRSLCA
jgi:hypothetical protein